MITVLLLLGLYLLAGAAVAAVTRIAMHALAEVEGDEIPPVERRLILAITVALWPIAVVINTVAAATHKGRGGHGHPDNPDNTPGAGPACR